MSFALWPSTNESLLLHTTIIYNSASLHQFLSWNRLTLYITAVLYNLSFYCGSQKQQLNKFYGEHS